MQFDEQLAKRKEGDRAAMDRAFINLQSILVPSQHRTQDGEPDDMDAVREILHHLGAIAPDVPEEITDENARLTYILRPSGIMRRRVELTGAWWKNATGPFLARMKYGGMVALLPRFPSGYRFYDARLSRWVKLDGKSAKDIEPDAFCFYRAMPAKPLSLPDVLKFLFLSVSGADIALVFGASLLVTLMGLVTPFINKQIFDSVIPGGISADVYPVAGLLLGAAVGSSMFGLVRSLVLTKLRDKISLSVQSAAMARMLSLPAAFFKQDSAGELSSRVFSISQLSVMLSDTALSTGLSALFSFVFIFQMANYAPTLTLPGVLAILAMLTLTIATSFLQQALSKRQVALSAKLTGLVFGLMNGIQKIKLAGAEKRAFAKWAEHYREVGKMQYAPPLFLQLNSAISAAVSFGGTLLLYHFAGQSRVSQSDYIAFSSAYGAVSGAILSLAGVAMTMARIKPVWGMAKPIFDATPEIDENKRIVTSLSGGIELSGVTFRYEKEGDAILDNLSLNIRPGEYVAIVGKSGCGKSTLMRLLLGLEKPEAGGVYYDGHDLHALDVRSVRQLIGTVLQDGKLFAGDIFSNIIVSAPFATQEDAWRAARLAGIAEDIKAMPMGMQTTISEGNGGISGGQKQRLLIARALVSNPTVLLFDEATSALDNITQKKVADALRDLGCTRVVIAHRVSTVMDCDRIVVMENGVIVEEGAYAELMDKKGSFYEFARRQTL